MVRTVSRRTAAQAPHLCASPVEPLIDFSAGVDQNGKSIIMGLQHKIHPVHGVQFHPESIASEHGHQLLANLLDIAGLNPRRRNVRTARHAA